MKVLLINPPYEEGKTIERRNRCTRLDPHGWIHPPLPLMYISSVLKEKKIKDIKLIDCIAEKINIDKLRTIIQEFQPNLVISWTGSFSYKIDIKALEIVKQINPKITTIVVGTDVVTAYPEKFLSTDFIDFAITSEAELAISDFVEYINKKRKLKDIRNIGYKSKTGKQILNKQETIKNPDKIPFPDRDIINNDNYRGFPFLSDKFTDIMTGRGCPFKCTFCTAGTYWGNKSRLRSPENVLEEFKQCVHKYEIKKFFLLDETFSLNPKRAIDICNLLIKENLDIQWGCETRVDLINDELINKMSKAGCVYLHFGVESGSQKVLDFIKKGITVEQIHIAFKLCKKYKIETCATIIVGTPVDTWDDYHKTIKLMKEINPDYIAISPFIPLPGSPSFKQFKEMGILKEGEFSEYVKPNIMFKPLYLTEEEIKKEYKKAWRYLSFRPRYISAHIYKAIKKRDLRYAKEATKAAGWIISTFLRAK